MPTPVDPRLIPEEPAPQIIDLMEEIARLTIKNLNGMQEINFETVIPSERCRMSVTVSVIF